VTVTALPVEHTEVPAPSPASAPALAPAALYVATSLDAWETGSPGSFEPDVVVRGVAYRRLDPAYYAWLRRCMDRAKAAHEAGKLDARAFDNLRARFNVVHAWAVERFGAQALAEAIRAGAPVNPPLATPGSSTVSGIRSLPDNPADLPPVLRDELEERAAIIAEAFGWPQFQAMDQAREQFLHAIAISRHGDIARKATRPRAPAPPKPAPPGPSPPRPAASPHLFPRTGEFRFTERVSADAIAAVDAIRDRALALGWTLPGLYQNRGRFSFPHGPEWGLVTFLGNGRRIGAVTREFIEIVNPGLRETRNRFPNMEVEQPWLKKVAPKAGA
jgi:hypothetical protein